MYNARQCNVISCIKDKDMKSYINNIYKTINETYASSVVISLEEVEDKYIYELSKALRYVGYVFCIEPGAKVSIVTNSNKNSNSILSKCNYSEYI